MDSPILLYATDEDIALRASADFALLCPRDQKIAFGVDGFFAASDPWTLRSASINFAAVGAAAGQVAQLLSPVATFRPPGEMFAIDSIGPNGACLRRKGMLTGIGQPPTNGASVSGVEFLIATLGPQIARASYDLDRRYGINDLVCGRTSSDLYDPREVREVTVLTVLYRQYLDKSRSSDGQPDALAAKADAIKSELDDLLARVVLHWQPTTTADGSRFSTRIGR